MHRRTILTVVLVLGAWTRSTHAQVLSAPSVVHAQPDGTFSFTAQLTAGAEPVTVATWEWLSGGPLLTTLPRGVGRSCDCSTQNCVVAPFGASSFEVTGKLVRPDSATISTQVYSTCNSMQFPQYSVQTQVLATEARPAPAMPPWAAAFGTLTLLLSASCIRKRSRPQTQV